MWEQWRAKAAHAGTGDEHGGGLCETDDDCLLLGSCIRGACACDAGFKGKHCAVLDLLPGEPSWGFVDPARPSWGGVPILHDGRYHLVASVMDGGCGLLHYGTNSAVFRAVSDSAHGPYAFAEELLPAFHHGPALLHSASEGFFIVADGKDLPASMVRDCTAGAGKPPLAQAPKQRISHSTKGLYAYAHSPHDQVVLAHSRRLVGGNWTQTAIVSTDLDAGWACNRTSPSPVLFANGSVLMALHTTRCAGERQCQRQGENFCEHLAMFAAPSVRGPYVNVLAQPIHDLEGSEDPFLWRGRRGMHMLVHSKNACGDFSEGCGLLASSRDGLRDWRSGDKQAYSTRVVWRGGRTEVLIYRQRPKILFQPDGVTPLMLFNGVLRRGRDRPAFVHTLGFPFNVSANAPLATMAAAAPESAPLASVLVADDAGDNDSESDAAARAANPLPSFTFDDDDDVDTVPEPVPRRPQGEDHMVQLSAMQADTLVGGLVVTGVLAIVLIRKSCVEPHPH